MMNDENVSPPYRFETQIGIATAHNRVLTADDIRTLHYNLLVMARQRATVFPAAVASEAPTTPNLWDGLAGAWLPVLGPTGSMLPDVSGHGNHGALMNMTTTKEPAQTPILPELVRDEYTGKPFRVIEIDDE